MFEWIGRWFEDRPLAEYGLILALIAVVCILTLAAISLAISGALGDVAATMP